MEGEGSPTWLHNFTRAHRQTLTSSRELTSLFALLSASVSNAQALPPYLHVPEIPTLAASRMRAGQVEGNGEGIQRVATSERVLGLENVNEEGYRAVVVVEVAQRAVMHGVERIVGLVRELVGEVDFGYVVVPQSEEVVGSGDSV